MCNLFFITFGFILCHLVVLCSGVTKIWQLNDSIHNPDNWIMEEDPEECEGLIFPDLVSGFTLLDSIDVKDIVLPKNGDIFLSDDANVVINEDSTDKFNCVILNKTKFQAENWSNRDNWRTEGLEKNPAMPPKEILPCEHDDIVIPVEIPSISVYYIAEKLKVRSFKFGNEMWTNEDLKTLQSNEDVIKIFGQWTILSDYFDITGRGCDDPSGCVCGNVEMNQAVCWYGNYIIQEQPCVNPVTPIGFCSEICGAYILFKPRKKFKIDSMKEILKNYDSHSYVSKVEQDMMEYIQVVFTETEFQGYSVYDANDLHQRLINEPELGARNPKLTHSQPKVKISSTVGIVFGTLVGVSIFFGIIFLLYSPRYQERIRHILEDRLHLPIRSSRATFTTQFMAKYRKDEDSGPFVDSQSTRGSVVSLEKSFENPMFGKTTPSTSSTSYDVNVTSEVMKSEGEMENPLFDAKRLEELRDIAENGDLVDLSDSSTNIP